MKEPDRVLRLQLFEVRRGYLRALRDRRARSHGETTRGSSTAPSTVSLLK
jgi:hypothetical protein